MEAWQGDLAGAQKRRTTAKKVAEAKRQKLLDTVENMPIVVSAMDEEILISRAIASYNRFHKERMFFQSKDDSLLQYADRESSPAFLQRIIVNVLRHQCSHYEDALEQIVGKVGVDAAYALLRQKVCAAIAATYPCLVDECERQTRSIGNPDAPDDEEGIYA